MRKQLARSKKMWQTDAKGMKDSLFAHVGVSYHFRDKLVIKKDRNGVREIPLNRRLVLAWEKAYMKLFRHGLHSRSLIDLLPSLRFLLPIFPTLTLEPWFPPFASQRHADRRIYSFGSKVRANKLAVRTGSDVSSFQLLGRDRCSSSVACHCFVD